MGPRPARPRGGRDARVGRSRHGRTGRALARRVGRGHRGRTRLTRPGDVPRVAPGGRRPDESMSLLVDLSSSSLDPGYAEAAARRGGAAARTPGARARPRPGLALALGVLAAT